VNEWDRQINDTLSAAAERCAFVLVPGLNNSGPEHWQSLWQLRLAFWQRITQSRWDDADIGRWTGAIRRKLAGTSQPAILVGHSFGALASVAFALDPARTAALAGLMLVAPAEPMRFNIEDDVPAAPLGLPAVVVASRNDPLMSFPRAAQWAEAWGASLVDLGEAGHINAQAGFGAWPYGLSVLAELTGRARTDK
jgi:hypothetical protein